MLWVCAVEVCLVFFFSSSFCFLCWLMVCAVGVFCGCVQWVCSVGCVLWMCSLGVLFRCFLCVWSVCKCFECMVGVVGVCCACTRQQVQYWYPIHQTTGMSGVYFKVHGNFTWSKTQLNGTLSLWKLLHAPRSIFFCKICKKIEIKSSVTVPFLGVSAQQPPTLMQFYQQASFYISWC